jgi:DNA processing protein
MEDDIIYQLALSKVSGIGPAYARKLIRHFGEAKPVFLAGKGELERICGARGASAIVHFDGFRAVDKELSFLEKYSMRLLFITGSNYPRRLLHCSDIPVLLFYKGNADLNIGKIVAIVGTRSPTQYGKEATQRLVKGLASSGSASASPGSALSGSASSQSGSAGSASPGILIVSGLAYGIDAIAHQAALDNDLPTVGILGHGLDRIYPEQNTSLAKKMVHQGGLLTKFNIDTRPDSHNFPLRNRIVAGMSDAVIVVETDNKGGSMLTARDAVRYKRKVFALPGRLNDPQSAGCNALIRNGQANLLINAQQFMEDMKWEQPAPKSGLGQAALFPPPAGESDLSEDEKKLLCLLREKRSLSHDEVYSATVDPRSRRSLPLTILQLELKGWIDSLPGKIYRARE